MSRVFEEITEEEIKEIQIPNNKNEIDIVKEKNPYIEENTIQVKALPSNGIFYLKGTELSYRLLSLGELRKLSSKVISIDNYESIKLFIDTCLNGISVNSKMDKYDILYYDFVYVSVIRKFPSLAKNTEEPYLIETKCPICENKQIQSIELENIGFKEIVSLDGLSIEYKKEIIKFKPMTLRKYLEVIKIQNEYSDLDNEILMIASYIDNEKTILENYKIVYESTDKKFIETVFNIYDKLDLGLAPYELDCSGCKNKYSITLDSSEVEYTIAFPSFF